MPAMALKTNHSLGLAQILNYFVNAFYNQIASGASKNTLLPLPLFKTEGPTQDKSQTCTVQWV